MSNFGSNNKRFSDALADFNSAAFLKMMNESTNAMDGKSDAEIAVTIDVKTYLGNVFAIAGILLAMSPRKIFTMVASSNAAPNGLLKQCSTDDLIQQRGYVAERTLAGLEEMNFAPQRLTDLLPEELKEQIMLEIANARDLSRLSQVIEYGLNQ